jgi:hypothetical protein
MPVETAPQNRIHDLETLEAKLAQTRDELRVKLHLARADARDSFESLEETWRRFRRRLAKLRTATGEAGEEAWSGVRALGRELAEGYDKIREAL